MESAGSCIGAAEAGTGNEAGARAETEAAVDVDDGRETTSSGPTIDGRHGFSSSVFRKAGSRIVSMAGGRERSVVARAEVVVMAAGEKRQSVSRQQRGDRKRRKQKAEKTTGDGRGGTSRGVAKMSDRQRRRDKADATKERQDGAGCKGETISKDKESDKRASS